MSIQTHSYITDSDVVKTEGKNRYSRDEAVIVSGSGALVCGAVLGRVTATGKFKPFAPAASDGSQVAAAVLLQSVDATSADKSVVILARHAEVVTQMLAWPGGTTPNQKSAAIAQLSAVGIVARNGV